MRLHRFFARNLSESKKPAELGHTGTNYKREISEGSIITCAYDTHQWQRVFRYGQGDRVIIFDGSGNDYVCEIVSFQGEINGTSTGVVLRVLEICENKVIPSRQVILVVAMVKKDIFEWIAEKATELGVTEIIPVLAERSEKKSLNRERVEKILVEASEQSGRGDVPVLHEMMELAEFLKNREVISSVLPTVVFDPSGIKFNGKDFAISADQRDKDKKLNILIGPEGGWSPRELESFKKSGLPILSLGPQILRVETAVVAVISKIVF